MSSRHAILPRGLNNIRSPLSQGRFGRMFRKPSLTPAQFGATEPDNIANLSALADRMIGSFDAPKDSPDAEESGIPALYTYFSQFVDHDITFDPVSSLTKQQDPDGLVDFRTPSFDLDNLYGRGPNDQPYMYDGIKFLLGEKLTGAGVDDANDLPRFKGRALIGDPRNDENSIVSQFQGLMLRFHNRMVDDNDSLTFEEVQQRVRFHYQYVVLNDFLPRIVHADVLNALKTAGSYDRSKLAHYHWHNYPFMPVEFSVAAYRLGHSMIRPGYRLNDADNMLLQIFPDPNNPDKNALTGFRAMGPGRAIDWGRFIDIDTRPFGDENDESNPDNKRRLQFAYRIDTSLVDPLRKLPPEVASNPASLALRNLERGWRLGLPSGQAIARAMQLNPLNDDQIIIGKAVDEPEEGDPQTPIATIANGVFAGNCPLWTYILAEARHFKADVPIPVTGGPGTVKTPQLGPVGGRIVAEVFLGLMFGDSSSVLSLDPQWAPVTGPGFALKDLVNYALGEGDPLH
ncbi:MULTISPECIES: peroxidase family protein [Bradyrhizobium]|uniref:peroxidase family protein n=1 Tax=Bradyrhizobium TaxID=374 RepID=UPI00041108BE|nr:MULTISPECIES: heme peroxidase family protein [Bradyrhizobium]QOG22653.1 heme peroxidase [Bradyrhizobium sp. SEMIA]UFW48346.1 heme peroxidase family protein [Bradyrhizobium arachidis]